MNPFEHQLAAPEFEPRRFIPENGSDLTAAKSELQSENPDAAPRPFDAQHHAIEFTQSLFLREQQKLRQEAEELKKFDSIMDIFESGNLGKITDFLIEERNGNQVFKSRVQRVQNEYNKELSPATFLAEKDWRILTALEMFDKGTFEHSLRTFTIAKEILETRLPKLGMEIEKEGVLLNQFYIACLFHDLGKFAIPKFILNSTVTDEVWTNIFMDTLSPSEQEEIFVNRILPVPDEIRNNHEELHEYFKKHDFRAISYVPVNKAFNTDEQSKIFTERGIDGNLPLTKIIEPHEENSKTMLRTLGYGLEALLAGHHHNYTPSENQEVEELVSTSALQVVVEIASDVIHTIDIFDALTSNRSYADDFSHLEVFSSIIYHAETGRIKNKWVAASIINAKLKTFKEVFSKETKELAVIKNFLSENLPKDEISYFNNQV